MPFDTGGALHADRQVHGASTALVASLDPPTDAGTQPLRAQAGHAAGQGPPDRVRRDGRGPVEEDEAKTEGRDGTATAAWGRTSKELMEPRLVRRAALAWRRRCAWTGMSAERAAPWP